MKEYKTVDGTFRSETVIERSKFICRIKGVKDEEDAKSFIDKIKKQESSATHNCYAYILSEPSFFKFSDDGEPHGTAGQPMYEVLKNRELFNVAAVVTRYFGGIKLGTGGLSRAYSGAVIKCLETAKTAVMKFSFICDFRCDYAYYKNLSKVFSEGKIKVIENDFSDKVKVRFAVKKEDLSAVESLLSEKTCGTSQIDIIESKYIAF